MPSEETNRLIALAYVQDSNRVKIGLSYAMEIAQASTKEEIEAIVKKYPHKIEPAPLGDIYLVFRDGSRIVQKHQKDA